MAQTMTNVDALLKEFYEDTLTKVINDEVPTFRILETSDKPWSGRRVVGSVHHSRNSGVGARAEGGTLPAAGQQGYAQSVVSATYQYGRGQISGQAMAAGKNAFVEALSKELDGLASDMKVDLGRQTWGDGSGRLAQVGTDSVTGTNSSIAVFNRFAEPGQPGARYIQSGMLLQGGAIADKDDGVMTSGSVQSISVASTSASTVDTITVDVTTALLSASSDFLFRAGTPDGRGSDLLGLRGLIDDFGISNAWDSSGYAGSSVQGINRASVDRWNAIVLHNNGTVRSATDVLIQQAFDEINQESGMEANMIMGHHSVVRDVFGALVNDRRFMSNGQGAPTFAGGFGGLTYGGVPIERDRQAPYNELFVFKKECLQLYTLKPVGFADDDGSIMCRVTNQDAYEFYVRYYGNIGFTDSIGGPKACAVIRDIRG